MQHCNDTVPEHRLKGRWILENHYRNGVTKNISPRYILIRLKRDGEERPAPNKRNNLI